MSDSWAAPTLPPGTHLSDEGESVFFGETAHGPQREPAPRLAAEIVPLKRPSATASFPLHPVAVCELFHRAAELLGGTPAVLGRSEDEQRALAAYLWLAAQALFRPGASMRGAIDDFVAGRKYLPPNLGELRGSTRLAAKRLAFVAAWAAVVAATKWAEDAE